MNPDFKTILQSDQLVLLDFWATWCAPCKAMFPVLDALQTELGERLRIEKIDVDKHLDFAVEMRVMGVPTFALYRNGQELWRDAGIFSGEQLKAVVSKFE